MTAVDLTQAHFSELLHTRFQAHSSSEATFGLELIEVREGRSLPGHEAFSLTFRGPLDVYLGQGMVTMAHDAIGEFELFMVPIAQAPDGFRYEAVFNR